MRALRILWAGPWSLLGVLLAPLFRTRRVVDGILVCEGASWPRRFGWRYRAITFGHVVLSIDELDDATLTHERVHVRQYERWGPLFVPAYLLATVATKLRGGHHYRDNPFEIAARRVSATDERLG